MRISPVRLNSSCPSFAAGFKARYLHIATPDIEQIELRRDLQQDTEAIYFLSPLPHIVDCLLADLERHRYAKSHLVWIALLDPQLRRRIDNSSHAKQQLSGFETLSVDFFPRESHLITFRDPWSFEVLFNESCNDLVAGHLQSLAQKVCFVKTSTLAAIL